MNDAILTPQKQEEKISRLYVEAVATRLGYAVSTFEPDYDGVDMGIRAGGKMRPAIDLQLKATINLKGPIDESYRFPLRRRNYELLQGDNFRVPRLLVVLHLPRDKNQWIVVKGDGLTLSGRAFWLNLRTLETLEETDKRKSVTVQIPKENLFDDASLRELMDQARTGRIE